MKTEIHQVNHTDIAEITAEEIIIKDIQDALDIMANLYYQDISNIIIHDKNLSPAFFDLKTGVAGEILQKFSNYRVRLAIVGDYARHEGKSIRDFIFESNKLGQVNFVNTLQEAIGKLSSK